MDTPLLAWFAGLSLGASLVVAVGAQNTFVLRQGLRREHVGAVVAVCLGLDAVLMSLGVNGVAAAGTARPLRGVLLQALACTLLNPHVYLDTLLLVGAVGAQQAPALRPAFVVGAVSASAAWFVGLGYGARLLAPVFARPAAWRWLDGGVAVTMALLGLRLAAGVLRA
ncbi:MAG: LysE family transporter [Burkholderiales bacterium]|nr:LysE family transporter [Burkholderiales bacterium]